MPGHRFFISKDKIGSTHAVISGDEAHHLRRVLRLAPGDEARIFDGEGREWLAVIEQLNGQQATLRIIEQLSNTVESPLAIRLAQGLIKGERFDLVIQKAVELGVAQLQPLISAHTDVQLSEMRAEKRLDRWQRIALEAAKQSGRRRLMTIMPPLEWSEFVALSSAQPTSPVIFFAERGGCSLKQIANQWSANQWSDKLTDITIVVGSEGGWSAPEIAQAQAANFQLVTLGARILRAETAAIAVAALVQYLFGDLGG
jgi:16S rRNA (uracil1498-N3)-methyltransferase